MDTIKNKSMKSGSMTTIQKGPKNGGIGSGHAGQQMPGQSASMGTSSGKFAQGGTNPDWGKQTSKTQTPA